MIFLLFLEWWIKSLAHEMIIKSITFFQYSIEEFKLTCLNGESQNF